MRLLALFGLGLGQKPVNHQAQISKGPNKEISGTQQPDPLPEPMSKVRPQLPSMLEEVAKVANVHGLKGWPEFGPESKGNSGRPMFQDPALERIWGNPFVLWHYTLKSNHWDALVTMAQKAPGPGNDGNRRLVFLRDVFGNLKLQEVGWLNPWTFFRYAPDTHGAKYFQNQGIGGVAWESPIPGFPRFVRTGEFWAYYQESDGSEILRIKVFHPVFGQAILVEELQTRSERNAELKADERHIAELMAKGLSREQAIEDGPGVNPGYGFVIEDLPEEARILGGLHWFTIHGDKFAVTNENWIAWKKRARLDSRKSPKGTNTNSPVKH